jgi:hypothetical protein
MTGKIVFLLEEPSMQALLDNWLPRLFPGWIHGVHFLCIPHEGKTDLDRSIPRKLSSWRMPGDRFVIVRDNDNTNCLGLKSKLTQQCNRAGRPDTLVRLVCQELESWYLGDLAALAAAYPNARIDTPANQKRYRSKAPDDWHKPSAEVERIAPEFQKITAARLMAEHLDPERNTSHSLQVFVSGIRHIAAQMGLPIP